MAKREPGGASERGRRARRRPPAVTILAIIQLLSALAYGLAFVGLVIDDPAALSALSSLGVSGTGAVAAVELAALRIVVGGFFVASLAGGILLLRMRQLGWTITMLLTGIALASSIYDWVTSGSVVAAWLLVQVVTVFYLNQRQVRQAFRISVWRPGEAPEDARG